MFGLKHIIIMLVSIILIVTLSILIKKISFKKTCKAIFILGIVSEIVKIFFYIIRNEEEFGGVLPKTDLPFHLCSIQIIFLAIINVVQNEKLKRFLLSFMLPSCLFGGIFAILIPTSSALNSWIITIQYFAYHISLVVFAIKIYTSSEIKLDIHDYFNALKMILIVMFFAFYINSIVYDGVSNINFMYVVKPPVDGLPYLTDTHGWFIYICHYSLLVLFCISICYVKPIINAIKSRKSKPAEAIVQPNLTETKPIETSVQTENK